MWLPRSDNDIALPAWARAQAELIDSIYKPRDTNTQSVHIFYNFRNISFFKLILSLKCAIHGARSYSKPFTLSPYAFS